MSEQKIIYVKHYGRGRKDGSSWKKAFRDLQEALEIAEAGDQIWVAAGMYKPTSGTDRSIAFEIPRGVSVYGGFSGHEGGLGERNWKENMTILSGEISPKADDSSRMKFHNENSFNVVRLFDPDEKTVLDGFTITGGRATLMDHEEEGQRNAEVTKANKERVGGGIYVKFNEDDSSGPVLQNLIITENMAVYGGGIAYELGEGPDITCKLSNVIFTKNLAASYGGGFFCQPLSHRSINLELDNITCRGNVAFRGAGVAVGAVRALVDQLHIGIEVKIENSTFTGNLAETGGGAIYVANNKYVRIANSISWNNWSINRESGQLPAVIAAEMIFENTLGEISSCICSEPKIFAHGSSHVEKSEIHDADPGFKTPVGFDFENLYLLLEQKPFYLIDMDDLVPTIGDQKLQGDSLAKSLVIGANPF